MKRKRSLTKRRRGDVFSDFCLYQSCSLIFALNENNKQKKTFVKYRSMDVYFPKTGHIATGVKCQGNIILKAQHFFIHD